MKYSVHFSSYDGKFIHCFIDYVAPLTNMCRKNILGDVVHTEATKDAFETLKARMILALVLLIPKARHTAEFVVATDTSMVGCAGMFLQEDTSGSLRPCAYWARKYKDCETRYSAYDHEILTVVEAMSRVRRVHLLECTCFSVVTDHATLTHLLKQPSDKFTGRQVY
jgi:hypothetical protein